MVLSGGLGLRKQMRQLETTKIKMLRMMCGKTFRDDISNETIPEMTGVEKIKKFLKEYRLQWFGHIKKINDKRALVKAKSFVVNGSKRGRPKKRWKKAIEKDFLAKCLERGDAQDHAVWRLGCKNLPT